MSSTEITVFVLAVIMVLSCAAIVVLLAILFMKMIFKRKSNIDKGQETYPEFDYKEPEEKTFICPITGEVLPRSKAEFVNVKGKRVFLSPEGKRLCDKHGVQILITHLKNANSQQGVLVMDDDDGPSLWECLAVYELLQPEESDQQENFAAGGGSLGGAGANGYFPEPDQHMVEGIISDETQTDPPVSQSEPEQGPTETESETTEPASQPESTPEPESSPEPEGSSEPESGGGDTAGD